MSNSSDKLCQSLGYSFKQPALLQTALTHSSYGKGNNERLEFLGDAILGWIIAEKLFEKFSHGKEGQLSRQRSGLVKGETLAQIGREFNLGQYLRLGQGELKSGGFRRDSTLADAVEAIIGAIYLDSDAETCRDVVLKWFESRLANLSLSDNLKDPKTRLQEYLQSRKQALPVYEITNTQGKEHQQTFEVSCSVVLLEQPAAGKGGSRRQAEQEAARQALIAMGVEAAEAP